MNNALMIGLLKFSSALFGTLPGNGENRMISPLSVHLALDMLMNGAGGATKETFEKALCEGSSAEEFHKELSAYLKELPVTDDASLSFANSIWANKTLHMKYRFSAVNRSYYNAMSKRLKFNAEAVERMNEWVGKSTDGMITHIIDTLDPADKLVIMNALAFKGNWEKAFESDSVYTEVFTNLDGSESSVKGMHSTENYYLQDETCTGFVKPYAGGRYAFAAMLPKEGISLEEFERSLSGEKYLKLISGASDQKVDIMLPKFTAEFEMVVNPQLSAMGLGDLLSGTADYSGISRYDFTLGEILHKTFIDVNETGTRAAAVTAVLMKSALPGRHPRVILDRPFVYAILDRKYGLPIFIGDVVRL